MTIMLSELLFFAILGQHSLCILLFQMFFNKISFLRNITSLNAMPIASPNEVKNSYPVISDEVKYENNRFITLRPANHLRNVPALSFNSYLFSSLIFQIVKTTKYKIERKKTPKHQSTISLEYA